jgi:hypothetical protein
MEDTLMVETHPLITILEVAIKLEEAGKLDRAKATFERIAKHPVTPTIKGLAETVKAALERIANKNAGIEAETLIEEAAKQKEVKVAKVEEVISDKPGIPKNLLMTADTMGLIPIKEIEEAMPVSDEEYKVLKESIAKRGIRNPLVVDRLGQVVCGYTRLKIAKELGLKKVPVIAIDIPAGHMLEYAIRDNVERRHMSAQQKMAALALIKTKKGAGRPTDEENRKTLEDIAEGVGVSKSTLAKSKMYQKKIDENPELEGQPVSKVLYGEPKAKKKETLTFHIGKDDTNMENKVLAIIQEMMDVDTEIGDVLKLTIHLELKGGKK